MANEPYAGMHIDRFDGGAPVPHGALEGWRVPTARLFTLTPPAGV